MTEFLREHTHPLFQVPDTFLDISQANPVLGKFPGRIQQRKRPIRELAEHAGYFFPRMALISSTMLTFRLPGSG